MAKLDLNFWKREIQRSRKWREDRETTWSDYAKLHAYIEVARAGANDDAGVVLPNGDQVKVGLVHRNVEQTLALMDFPDVSLKATVVDSSREVTREDNHRQSLVEGALDQSMIDSQLLSGTEEADAVKRDGIICGHGVNYSYWREVSKEVAGPKIPKLTVAADGSLVEVLDEAGNPVFEQTMETVVSYEAVQDQHVPVTEFLFDTSRQSIRKGRWYAIDQILSISEARRQNIEIPADVKGSSFTRRNLYGEEAEEQLIEDAVRVIDVWDRHEKRCYRFLEANQAENSAKPKRRRGGKKQSASRKGKREGFWAIKESDWPIEFSHPDHSPFSFLIPIPANDVPGGISQIEHSRIQGLEVDKIRTRLANMGRESKEIVVFDRNAVNEDEVKTALSAPHNAAVGVDLEEGKSLSQHMERLSGANPPPGMYDQLRLAEEDIRKTTGVSEIPHGGADTATESEHIFQVGSARPRRKSRMYLKFLAEVAHSHLAMHAAFAKPGQVITVAGGDGASLVFEYGRQAFAGKFNLKVIAGEINMSPIRQKMVGDLFGMLKGSLGPEADLVMARQVLTLADFPAVNDIMKAARNSLAPPMPQAPTSVGNPNDFTNGQALRAGANPIFES